jgi:hypothetical protein
MQSGFESIQEAPPENGVVWVWHVKNIKSDVFSARVFRSVEGDRECDGPD